MKKDNAEKDKQIEELKKQNADVQQSCENYYNEMRVYKTQVKNLKAQIEKMKSDVKTVYLQNDFINKSPYQNMSDKLTALSELIKSWN